MREERQRQQRFTVHGLDSPQMMIGIQEFPISGLTDFVGVFASGITRFLPNTAIARFLVGLATNPDPAMRLQFLIFSDAFVQAVDPRGSARVTSRVEVEYSLKELTARSGETELDSAGFLSAVNESEHRLSVFNPWSWRRAESYGDF
jgi:O-methyltransferase involved in polyketide biosynthesis